MHSQLQFEWYDIERDPAGWDDSVNGTGQNLFHRSATLAAEQHGRAVRRGIVVKRFGACICLVGGLVIPQGTGGVFHALSFPPASRRVARDLPDRIVNWLYFQGLTAVHIGCHDGGVEGYRLDPRLGRARDRLEFVCDLHQDEEQRLQSADPAHRRLFEASQREPMLLRRIDRRQALHMAGFRALWARRRGERLQLMGFVRDYLYYRRLAVQMELDGSGNLYALCDERGATLAMAYMLERGETAYCLTGAGSEDGKRRGAAVRLFFELARHYSGRGIRWMNMGGVSAQAANARHRDFAAYRFKLGFGGAPVLRRALAAEV